MVKLGDPEKSIKTMFAHEAKAKRLGFWPP
jgi:hypothetical protein